jgi:hypothetical protein
MTVLTILVLLLIGVIIGFGIAFFVFRQKTAGTIQIDHSDPSEPPYLFARLSVPVELLSMKKKASFEIRVENFIPRE